MIKHITTIITIGTILTCSGCASMLRIDGPHEGTVIDADTMQPIEGVVVHGSWIKRYIGGGSEFYDSREVLTDKHGEFKIPGQGLLVLSHIQGMYLTIFKAGYTQWGLNIWNGLKGKWEHDEITWEDDKGTFRIKKMTLEARRKRIVGTPNEPNNKIKLFMREENKENIEIGSGPNTMYPAELLQ